MFFFVSVWGSKSKMVGECLNLGKIVYVNGCVGAESIGPSATVPLSMGIVCWWKFLDVLQRTFPHIIHKTGLEPWSMNIFNFLRSFKSIYF